ncbi:50S ribosomal protein L11 [Candidatus Woesearchaeota archaeon]|nr:50S ribosomal protein L11 [Candidatus Woesearchaeota archaeon]
MASQTIESLIEGGKASAAPPLGPALGPLGVNIGAIVAKINEMTGDFKGMKVPVKVTVDTETKDFEIEIGTPPATQLIKQEAGIQKGSGRPQAEHVADLAIEQVIKIAKMKQSSLLAANSKAGVKEIIGTCNSMGVKVEGTHAAETIKRVEQGEFDEKIASGKTELTAEEMAKLEAEKKAMQAELKEKHAEMEKTAQAILETAGGDAVKARKAMEEDGTIDQTIIDKVAPRPVEGDAAAPAGDAKPEAEKK